MKLRKPIFVTIILALVAAMMLFAVACGGEDDKASKTYTMRFETYGGTEIQPITAVGGSMIFAPSAPVKSGSTFEGWYTNPDFDGEAVVIPNIMPKKNVTYYAKFDTPQAGYTLIYEYNMGKVPHAKDIANVTVQTGETVTVADGNDYGAEGYVFMGWSIYPNGFVADVKQDGQYNAGDKITLTDKNVKLYAQWAVVYTDARGENDDKIYVYEPLIGTGLGAARLVRADKELKDLDGFVDFGSDTASGKTEFAFYDEDFSNGAFVGRLNANRTYATADGMQGQYAQDDYVLEGVSFDYVIELDGFGNATYLRRAGDRLDVYADGKYEYSAESDDYIFKFTTELDDDDAKAQTTHFNVAKKNVQNPEYIGSFTIRGGETGTFKNVNYATDGKNWNLELDGYGSATLIVYGPDGKTVASSVTGKYYGTDNYASVLGEWQFEPSDNSSAFRFTLLNSPVRVDNSYIYVFRMRDESIFGTYASANENDKSVLYIDGYGSAEYISKYNGIVFEGACTVNGGIATLVCTAEENDEEYETDRIIFSILDDKKFKVYTDDCVIDGGVLTGYQGTATVVEIPSGVTAIADDAFNYSKKDKNTRGISLTSVTIPDGVTSIGARAFQNNHTLRRVVCLGATPAALNYSDVNDNPFDIYYNDFIIIVPDTAVAAYKRDWSVYADRIVGATEATTELEWVTQIVTIQQENYTVLVRYNKQAGAGDELELVIPEYIDIINNDVFSGMRFIKSVDLNNVILVGEGAFYGCVNLETVNMPNVRILDTMAFAACESLKLVQFGEDISEIGDFAFYKCNVHKDDSPLVIDLGESVPEMGSKITLDNFAVMFKVDNIDVALNCYKSSSWADYCGYLYIESGDESGMYISGDVTLELDGRAIYQGTYVWMYALDGEKITFYEYNSSNMSYTAIEGKYKNSVISIALGSTMRNFVRIKQTMEYTSKDGYYTLVCNPTDLLPDSYEDNSGTAKVMFNGKEVELYVNGYDAKIIYNYEENGKLYDIYVDFRGDELDITKKLSPIMYSDITAEDESTISILFQNDNIYIIAAEFKTEVGGRTLRWTAASGKAVTAKKNGNVFTFSLIFRGVECKFTVTVSEDYTTFSYTKA